jgi:hypothetical protein
MVTGSRDIWPPASGYCSSGRNPPASSL